MRHPAMPSAARAAPMPGAFLAEVFAGRGGEAFATGVVEISVGS